MTRTRRSGATPSATSSSGCYRRHSAAGALAAWCPRPSSLHDRGVDVVSADPDGERLAVQTKLSIREKSEFDEILSKFQDYEATKEPTRRWR